MSRHTPGVWYLRPAFEFGLSKERNPLKDDIVVCTEPDPMSAAAIALVYCDVKSDQDNARLIAAAPEMLEALHVAAGLAAAAVSTKSGAYQIIAAAIAKAEGKS